MRPRTLFTPEETHPMTDFDRWLEVDSFTTETEFCDVLIDAVTFFLFFIFFC